MKRKQQIMDGTVYKWKAGLNMDGGKHVQGLDYLETYAPAVAWSTIRAILVLTLQKQWVKGQLDFVQAYPQAPVETELYMDIPNGYQVQGKKDQHNIRPKRGW
jgi:Reverse transcriptase (RNA-dependent DNA polymerase)